MTWQEAYRILELSTPKTLEEVREAYSIQVKAWHPDRFEGDSKMHRVGTAKMKLVNEAFKFVKDNWSKRAPGQASSEFESPTESANHGSTVAGKRKTGLRDILTVLDNGTSEARKNKVVVAAKRVHEYLGDATVTVSYPGHRQREVRLKVGESATLEFSQSILFEIRLLQIRKVYKVRRGMLLPQALLAIDMVVTKMI
ncbi:MAG: J domain-containing protein [Bacteroidetes bacterium]|nr:J domain-containing protein [Bacteroidota bacterium]